MVSWWKVLGVAAATVQSVRIQRQRKPSSVSFGGVPVLNFDRAFKGKASMVATSELMQDWVLVAEKGTTDSKMAALCSKAKCLKQGHPDKRGVPFFEVRATLGELKTLLENSDGAVKFAEPDGWMQMSPEIEAEQTTPLWGLKSIGAASRTSEGEGVTIFVLDTGVRGTHSDFGGRVVPFMDVSKDPPLMCNGDLSCALDIHGHGTHCAGTAAGTKFGVAPKALVGTVKVLSDEGPGAWSWSYTALDALATSEIRPAIASMSLGGEGTLSAMKEAVDVAVDAGVTVVVAGGNENSPASYFSPAFIPSAITVGSTTSDFQRSYFSNFGSAVDLWAPGSDILSAGQTDDEETSVKSGTSMACPHVSGAAALILSENPSLSSSEVLAIMLDKGIKDAVEFMKCGDTNSFLWVGAEPAPDMARDVNPFPPVNPCDATGSSDLNFFGLCVCKWGYTCQQNGTAGCLFRPPRTHERYFDKACTDCVCVPKSVE